MKDVIVEGNCWCLDPLVPCRTTCQNRTQRWRTPPPPSDPRETTTGTRTRGSPPPSTTSPAPCTGDKYSQVTHHTTTVKVERLRITRLFSSVVILFYNYDLICHHFFLHFQGVIEKSLDMKIRRLYQSYINC